MIQGKFGIYTTPDNIWEIWESMYGKNNEETEEHAEDDND